MSNFIAFNSTPTFSGVLGLETFPGETDQSNRDPEKESQSTNYRALRESKKDTASFLSNFKSNLGSLGTKNSTSSTASSHFLGSFSKSSSQSTTRSFNKILEGSKLSILDPSSGPILNYVNPGSESRRRLKATRKSVRDSIKNGIKAPELTDSTKNDLEALSLRSVLDPKHFYKRNHMPVKPKYFQVGRIVENPQDYYSSRVPKRQRKSGIAQEMLEEAGAKFRQAATTSTSIGQKNKKKNKKPKKGRK